MFAPHSLRYSLASRPLRVSLLCRLQTAIALHRQRRALARLDAAALADIGLTRAEALSEAQRPFWDAPDHWHR